MSRLFDPVEAQNLMDQQLGMGDTRRIPLPQGETVAQIMEGTFVGGLSGPKAKNPGQPWNKFNVKLEITDPEYVSQYPGGAEKLTTNLGIMVDMQNGLLATGPNKNIQLNRFREAAGCNGKPLSALPGNYVRITIGHKPHPTEEGVVLDEVTGYTKV